MAEVKKAPQPTVPGGLVGEDPSEKFKYLNVLFHAFGGLGKTTACASACLDPRTAPVLVCDFEGGAPIRFAKMPKGTYTIRSIRSVKDLNDIYEYLRKGDHPYKSVVLDSLTEIQKLGLMEFVYGPGGIDKSFMGSVINVKTAEIQHWGKSGSQMGMIVRYFRDLPMHVFFTTLTQTTKDELTGKITYNIALPGKQADEVPGIPDIVGYIDVVKDAATKQDVRAIYFQPTGKVIAKDRTDALGAIMKYEKDSAIVTQMLDKVWTAYGISD